MTAHDEVRAKSLKMLDNWAENYRDSVRLNSGLIDLAAQIAEESPADSAEINECVLALQEENREISILLRIQQLSHRFRHVENATSKLEAVIARFFESRSAFLSRWEFSNSQRERLMGLIC